MARDNAGAEVRIDGIYYGKFSSYNSAYYEGNYLFFEKLGLGRTFHKVEIKTLSRGDFNNKPADNWFALDAIYI